MRTPSYPRFSWQSSYRTAAEQCEVCGKPATQYVGAEEGYSASGHNVCDAHADRYKTSSRKTADGFTSNPHYQGWDGKNPMATTPMPGPDCNCELCVNDPYSPRNRARATASRKTAITMSRQHFELIADTIASSSLSPMDKYSLANDFASALAATNGQFDRTRFIEACTD